MDHLVLRHPSYMRGFTFPFSLSVVTQDQFTQVSKKVSNIPEENFTINIELFR
jgi:hypothetical protein